MSEEEGSGRFDAGGGAPSGGAGRGWAPGGEISSLSKSAAKAEIAAIESDENFAGEGKMGHWERQKMLRRRSELYDHAGSEMIEPQGMGAELERQGVTKESLEAQQEKFRLRDEDDEMELGRRELDKVFGNREKTEAVVKKVQGAVKTYTSQKFTERLFKSGTANSPVIVQAVNTIIEEIERAETEMKLGRKRKGGRV